MNAINSDNPEMENDRVPNVCCVSRQYNDTLPASRDSRFFNSISPVAKSIQSLFISSGGSSTTQKLILRLSRVDNDSLPNFEVL